MGWGAIKIFHRTNSPCARVLRIWNLSISPSFSKYLKNLKIPIRNRKLNLMVKMVKKTSYATVPLRDICGPGWRRAGGISLSFAKYLKNLKNRKLNLMEKMVKKTSYATVSLRDMWPWVAEGWPCLAWAACGPGPLTSLRSRPGSQTRWVTSPVPHEILVRVRIRGSIPLTNGSGCGFGSCYFRQWPSRRQQKFFLLITFWRYIYIIFQR